MSEQNRKVSLPTIYGVKAGMTRIFSETGEHIPVTVIKLIPNVISQVKNLNKDKYEAYQVAYYEKRARLVSKPIVGHLAKAKIEKTFCRFAEIRMEGVSEANLGVEVSFDEFPPKTFVDVTATSKGKGFQGVMKRHNFSGGPASHGSHFHRRPGAIGNRATPARVFAQKKMPGQMGNEKVTIQNLQVVAIDEAKGILLVKGGIPGSSNSFVKITKAIKKTAKV